jgi:hypothetical protein
MHQQQKGGKDLHYSPLTKVVSKNPIGHWNGRRWFEYIPKSSS